MEIVEAAGAADLDAAARIWAKATAARDGDDQVAGLDRARPVIEQVLASSPRSFLLLARLAGEPVGFAAVEPIRAGPADSAELRYLGVSPDRWSRGAARALLEVLPERLRGAGFTRAELLVYVENRRATALYRAAGWRPVGGPTVHPGSGRPEQRYRLAIG